MYLKLNFVLKIDRELNVINFRNKSGSSKLKGPTSAELKATRQFQAKSFGQINANTSFGLLAFGPYCLYELHILNLDSKTNVATLDAYGYVHHLVKINCNRFASGSKQGAIQIWSSRNFKCLKSFRIDGRLFDLRKLHASNQLMSFQDETYDQMQIGVYTIKISDINSGKCLQRILIDDYALIDCLFERRFCSIILNNGNMVHYEEGDIKVWNIARNGQLEFLKTINAHSSNIKKLDLLVRDQVISFFVIFNKYN